jgi:ribosomal protein L16 Arg81 hydroxylase
LLENRAFDRVRMSLQTLLGDVPKSKFVADHLHRFPYSASGGARAVCSGGSWAVLGEILRRPAVDVMVARRGQQVAQLPSSLAAAQTLSAEGCTILVRNAQRHDPQLLELASAFERDFAAPVNIHFYATPPGEFGFGWHYDAEDVFILQTGGVKEYSLRKNTVHPWPLEETIPQDMRYPAEIMPLMRVLLKAGDWLYIPCGWWHKAEAPNGGEAALSLAIGVMSPAAIALYDFLRPRLLESLLWRQKLPVLGEASPLAREELLARLRTMSAELAQDLQKILNNEQMLAEYLDAVSTMKLGSARNSHTR